MGLVQRWYSYMVLHRTVPPVQLAGRPGSWLLFLIRWCPLFIVTTRADSSCALFSMFHGLKKSQKVKIWWDFIKSWIAIVFLAQTFALRHAEMCLVKPAGPTDCCPRDSITTLSYCEWKSWLKENATKRGKDKIFEKDR